MLKHVSGGKNQPQSMAICMSFCLRHFSGQVVEFGRFYRQFSDFNSRFLKIQRFSERYFEKNTIFDCRPNFGTNDLKTAM